MNHINCATEEHRAAGVRAYIVVAGDWCNGYVRANGAHCRSFVGLCKIEDGAERIEGLKAKVRLFADDIIEDVATGWFGGVVSSEATQGHGAYR